ncbi:MAG: O-antigen ligase family protein [Chloroflexota bacterium]
MRKRGLSAIRDASATDVLAVLIVLGEWTGLARAVLHGPYYAAVLDVAMIGLVVWVGALRRVPRLSRLSILLALTLSAYFLLAAVEILNPNVPSVVVGLEGFRKTAFTMLAFVVVVGWGRGDAMRFYRIVALGSVLACLFAIRQFVSPAAVDLEILNTSGVSPITFHSGVVLRAFSPTAGPFHLGAIAACVTIISLGLARSGARWWVAVSVIAAVVVGLTLTRANMIAVAVGITMMILVSANGGGRGRAIMNAAPAVLGVVLAALIASGALAAPGTTGPPPTAIGTETSPEPSDGDGLGGVVTGVLNPLEDRNLQFRFQFWGNFLVAFLERPLVGYGTSAAADGFDRHYANTGSMNFEPHSLYVKSALELGIFGVILIVGILGLAFALGIRARSRAPVLGLIGVGISVVIAVSGITTPMLDAYPVNLLFWSTLGWLALAASRASVGTTLWQPARPPTVDRGVPTATADEAT